MIINNKKILIISLSVLIAANIAANSISAQIPQNTAQEMKSVTPLELVTNPEIYLNNKVKFTATFDKFSTLGLDYKPALRDSKKHISFLIKRPDVSDHTIPLSELKLIIPREKAEKLIDMESGDKIELTGQVFSTALSDPWIDVENVKIISSKTKTVSDKSDKTDKTDKEELNSQE